MSQFNRGLVLDVLVPEVRDKSEDFWRDAVDRCKAVPLRTDQAEELGSVLLKSRDLKEEKCK